MSQVTPLLEAAEKRRGKIQDDLNALVATPSAEGRKALTEDETVRFNELTTSIDTADEQIKKFRKQAKREDKATEALAKVEAKAEKRAFGDGVIISEPKVYDRDNKRGGSYFQDLGVLASSSARLGGSSSDSSVALERMERNAKQVEVDTRNMKEKERRQFASFIESQGGSTEKRVNPNTTFGQGGEFVYAERQGRFAA